MEFRRVLFRSEAALKQLDSNPDLVRDQIEDVVHAGQTAQIEMRALLLHLRPVYLSGDSLPKGIARLVAELREKSELQFTVQINEDLSLSKTRSEERRVGKECYSRRWAETAREKKQYSGERGDSKLDL